jgi:hypothetical protein
MKADRRIPFKAYHQTNFEILAQFPQLPPSSDFGAASRQLKNSKHRHPSSRETSSFKFHRALAVF